MTPFPGSLPPLRLPSTPSVRRQPLSSIAHVNDHENNKPLTSIAHANNSNAGAVTSVVHIGQTQRLAGSSRFERSAEEEQAITDNLREKYILKRMKEKQAAAIADANKQPKPTRFDLDIATGKSLKRTGAGGLKRQITKHFHEHRASFKNISKEDREMFTDVVGNYAKRKVTNVAFTKYDKKKLRKEMTKQWKAGTISKKDKTDFGKIISRLD